MATQDSTHGEPRTTDGSVLLQGLDAVRRAGRIVAAGGRQQWAECNLVAADDEDEDVLHVSADDTLAMSSRRSVKLASYASRRARSTRSREDSRAKRRSRASSRRRRLSLLRLTAV